ncbi:hypothetical protein ACFL0I_03735, partial [Gemmatimonadota bacterium]
MSSPDFDSEPAASPEGGLEECTRPRDVLAWTICRSYALLPIFITPILGGVLTWIPTGEAWAWALTGGAVLVMASRFREFSLSWRRVLATAVVYAIALSIPAVLLPRSPGSLLWGFLVESAIMVMVIAATNRTPLLARNLDLLLLPDVITSVVLIALFHFPVSFRSKRRRDRPVGSVPERARPSIAVVLTAYQEEATIRTSVRSIRRAVREAQRRLSLASVRLVLAVTDTDQVTIRKAREAG